MPSAVVLADEQHVRACLTFLTAAEADMDHPHTRCLDLGDEERLLLTLRARERVLPAEAVRPREHVVEPGVDRRRDARRHLDGQAADLSPISSVQARITADVSVRLVPPADETRPHPVAAGVFENTSAFVLAS